MIRLFGKSFAPSNNQKGLETQQPSFEDGTSSELNEKNNSQALEHIKNGKIVTIEVETSTSRSQENEEQGKAISCGTSSQEHTLKKPDKIIPCPRCTSMDTKFCYYNNYNVNQPRHFCRKCQRYWTAGGMMRSVPVGSGRRKNKKHAHHALQNLVSCNNSLEESTRSNDVYAAGFGSNVAAFCESTSQQSAGFASDQFSNTSDQMGSSTAILLGSNNNGFPFQVPFFYSSMPHWPTFWPCNISGAWTIPDSLNQSFMSSSSPAPKQ